MTDSEKLQRLFNAALCAPEEEIKAPTQIFPIHAPAASVPVAGPRAIVEEPITAEAQGAEDACESPLENVGLDEESSKELGALLEDQIQRKSLKVRRELLLTLIVLVAVSGGSFGWFVQSADRMTAAKSAYHDIRSLGDVAGMVGTYKKSLDRIAARAHEVDGATESMGSSASVEGEKDAQMDAEMHSMMIGGGKTSGERNHLLAEKMGEAVKGIAPEAAAAVVTRPAE